MPACTQYDILKVTGTNTNLDGLYYKYADLWSTTDHSAWSKPQGSAPVQSGSLSSITYMPGGGGGWAIFNGALPHYLLASDAVCPVNLTLNKFFFNSIPGAANTALITAYTPTPLEPTFGLPADVVAQIVAAHGSVANFLRLRNQGQI